MSATTVTEGATTLCLAFVRHPCVTTSFSVAEWAAWVQAVGSILAIVVAVILIRWQHRLQTDIDRRRTLEEELRQLTAFCKLGRWNAMFFSNLAESFSSGERLHSHIGAIEQTGELEVIKKSFKVLDESRLESSDQIMAALSVRRHIDRVVGAIVGVNQLNRWSDDALRAEYGLRLTTELAMMRADLGNLEARQQEIEGLLRRPKARG